MDKLQEVHLKLMQNGFSRDEQERVFRNLKVPQELWDDHEQRFMAAVMAKVKRRDETIQGLVLWGIIIAVVVLVYLAFFRH